MDRNPVVYNQKGKNAAIRNQDRDPESVMEIIEQVGRDNNEIIVKVKVISEGGEKGQDFYTFISYLQDYSKPTKSVNSKQP
tara:strand:- start:660 stop:902 length:243 start_codon:yes stop_codon:yes gene_type:complete